MRRINVGVLMAILSSVLLLFSASAQAELDHLKCYKFKDALKLRGPKQPWLNLEGPHFGAENCRIVGAFRLFCVPVSKSVTGDIQRKLVPPGGRFEDFAPVAFPGGEEIAQEKICYKIKCEEKSPTPPNPELEITDQFGSRIATKLHPFLLCGPAVKGSTTTTTMGATTTTTTTIPSVCGDGIRSPGEECDDTATPSGCDDTYQCVAAGLTSECTCLPPCELNPVPNGLKLSSELTSGICGCTLSSPDEAMCGSPSKIGDLACGKVYVGGGLSAVRPGLAPDGATTYVEFPVCGGTQLLIGPSVGTSPKDCSFGAGETGGPCSFGPTLPIEILTPAISSCVLNTLKENVKGVFDAATGHVTMSVEVTSRIFLTGDMIKATCFGGPHHGSPCSRHSTAKRGGTCEDGTLQDSPCTSDADCEGGGACVGVCGACSNDDTPCQDNTDCTGGGVCRGVCADEAEGECDDSGERCRLKGVCDGPVYPGLLCATSEDCFGLCVGGSTPGNFCAGDSQCYGGMCANRDSCMGTCIGGGNPADLCTDDSDCDVGTCGFSDCPTGTCVHVGGPVQPCPTCVDESFNLVTDGSLGMCNLGANRGMACVSTNSLGLTTDCLPAGGPEEEVGADNVGLWLADINVTIPAITTGKAEMIADEDGRFCNFGRCVGGERSGEECDNGRGCPGGTCQKYCQVLGGADTVENDPDNDPTCDVDDDCIEAGMTSWRPCGQSDPGAFTGNVDGEVLGGPTVRRFIVEGGPAMAPVAVGDIWQSKLVAAFCIPRTGEPVMDNADSLAGPGAGSLQATLTLLGD